MATLIAYANTQQSYPFEEIPSSLVFPDLLQEKQGNSSVQQRHQCRRLAHFLLWRLLQISNQPSELLAEIYRTPSGRPQFPLQYLDFNVSHSANWVAVALQISLPTQPAIIGIDIEYPQKTRNFTALLKQFASQQEQQWFTKQSDLAYSFYRIWCGREALLKSQGVGIVKLSEVIHYPEQLRLFSTHCPRGHLIFSGKLPFYLSLFTQTLPKDIKFFCWTKSELQPFPLQPEIIYPVNEHLPI